MKYKNEINRRKFIKTTAVAGAAITVPTILPARVFGANDRINAAVLGLNGRGKSHVSGLMVQDNVQVTHLCDPDLNILKKRQKDFKEKYKQDIAIEQDLRNIMDNKDIHVVSIATVNHWHALATIWACQAGKDVYVGTGRNRRTYPKFYRSGSQS